MKRSEATSIPPHGEFRSGALRVLVNPAAGQGRAGRRVEAVARALAQVAAVDVVHTVAAGDEHRLALNAANANLRALVVLGGDGTVSKAATALARAGASLPLIVIPAGTGNDLHKSLHGVPRDVHRLAAWLDTAQPRAIDCASIAGHWFVNAAGLGFDAAVLARTLRTTWPRGPSRYVTCAVRELFTYRGTTIRGVTDGSGDTDPVHTAPPRWLTLVAANGQWFGGAFRIAPQAQLDDGRLQLVAVRDASPWRRLQLFAAAPAGRHISAAEVLTRSVEALTVTLPSPPLLQVDGELIRAATPEITMQVHPRALQVYG